MSNRNAKATERFSLAISKEEKQALEKEAERLNTTLAGVITRQVAQLNPKTTGRPRKN